MEIIFVAFEITNVHQPNATTDVNLTPIWFNLLDSYCKVLCKNGTF